MSLDILRRPENQVFLVLLRALQNKVDWLTRDALAQALAEISREAGGMPAPAPGDPGRLEELRRAGLCKAPLEPTASQCAEVLEYFRKTPCYTAHVPAYSDGVARAVEEAAKTSTYGSYRLAESLAAPRLLELALDPRILALAGSYFGCVPSLYSVNTFWTFPSGAHGLSHGYHRDEDDFRFLALFVYWTPVEPGEGELQFIEGTHDYHRVSQRVRPPRWLKRHLPFMPPEHATNPDELRRLNGGNGYGYDEYYERLFSGDIRVVAGPAGTAVLADTFALHRGTPPRSRPRLVTWFRYGLYDNAAYRHDKTEPVPASLVRERIADDPATRYVSRLVLDWER